MAQKKVFEIVNGNKKAIVYKNTEWEEFIVKFSEYLCNAWVHRESADYHESFNKYDKESVRDAQESAIATARNWAN